jgi:hypothetical protein
MSLRRLLTALILTAALAAAADPVLLGLLMKDPRFVAGIDIDRAKASSFGQRMLAEVKVGDKDLEAFLVATGFDPRRDLREVVVASKGEKATKDEQHLVVARGVFDTARIAQYAQEKGLVAAPYKGVQIWSDPKSKQQDGAIAFLSGTLAVAGTPAEVQAAIDRRGSSPTLGAALINKVTEWSGANDAWLVTTVPVVDLMRQGSPANRPQGPSLESIREAYGGVRFGNDVQISGEAVTRSDRDATALADVLQFFVNMVRLNDKNPGAEGARRVLETLEVSTSGASVRFRVTLPQDEVNRVLDQQRGSTPKKAAPARTRAVI